MDLTWNLDNIYTSFDSEKFKNDMRHLEESIEYISDINIQDWKNNENSVFKIEEFLKQVNKYKELYFKISIYASLIMNADTKNVEAGNTFDYVENKNSELTKVLVKFSRWLRDLEGLDKIIDKSEYLLEHKFYLKELLLKSKFLLSEKEESIISKMKNTGSRAWEKYYMELISTATEDVIINGNAEKLTISQLNSMTHDKEKSLRKIAYYKEADLCRGISEACAKCINGISGEALTIYEMRGYKSPLEKVILNSRMDFETLNVMISAIKESLPVFRSYYEKKAQLLGYKNKLPFYDLYAPIKESKTEVSYMEAKELIISSFQRFSKKLSCFAERAFEERWIDAEPRRGKGNFGLELDIFPIKQARILTNFNGKFEDVSVLAHEIGHAYHGSNIYNQTMLNTDCPTPIAETASIFCETILNNELMERLPQDEAVIVLENSISNDLYFIVDFYGRYLFENQLFEKRKSSPLSVDLLNKLMVNCMKEAYGENMDSDTLHPYMWMNKAGYFFAGNEFLNFPYSFGVLFSKALYSQYRNDKENFADKYDMLLSKTSTNNIVDVAKIMGIDVHSIDFWRSSLKIIEEDIQKFINII